MPRDEAFAAYYNARVRGMKSRLLDSAQLDNMLDSHDVNQVIDTLLDSPYKEDLAEARARLEGAEAIEEAVTRNMVRTFQKLVALAGDSFTELTNLLFSRWDLRSVKQLLRLRHAGESAPDIVQAGMMPGPRLTLALMQDFAERETMRGLVGALAAWNRELCGCLEAHMDAYEETGELKVLEEALDRAYFTDNVKAYEHKRDEDHQFVCKLLQMEIDRINLRTILSLRDDEAGGVDAAMDRLLPGGTLSDKLLRRMAEAESAERAMELLGPTAYRSFIEGLYRLIQTHDFSHMERYFEWLLLKQLKQLARQHSLSIAVVMYYMWAKYNEVVNLRLIARGKARHLPTGQVREEIFYV